MHSMVRLAGRGAAAAAVAALAAAGAAHAQRLVIVNGERLGRMQIEQLDRLNCSPVPDGRYWLDPRSGAWGHAGNPLRQGFVGEACRRESRPKSLSERGLLYRPGEILNGR